MDWHERPRRDGWYDSGLLTGSAHWSKWASGMKVADVTLTDDRKWMWRIDGAIGVERSRQWAMDAADDALAESRQSPPG